MSFDYEIVNHITNDDFLSASRGLLDDCKKIEENYCNSNWFDCCADVRVVNETIIRYIYQRVMRKTTRSGAGAILNNTDFLDALDDDNLCFYAGEVQKRGNNYHHDKLVNETEDAYQRRLNRLSTMAAQDADKILEDFSKALVLEIEYINNRISSVRGILEIKYDSWTNKKGNEVWGLVAVLTDVVDYNDFEYYWWAEGNNAPFLKTNDSFRAYRTQLYPWMRGKTITLQAKNKKAGQVLTAKYGPLKDDEINGKAIKTEQQFNAKAPLQNNNNGGDRSSLSEDNNTSGTYSPATQMPKPPSDPEAKADKPNSTVEVEPKPTVATEPEPTVVTEPEPTVAAGPDPLSAQNKEPAEEAPKRQTGGRHMMPSRSLFTECKLPFDVRPNGIEYPDLLNYAESALRLIKVKKEGNTEDNGTGFLIEKSGYILTCEHVIHDYIEIRARGIDNQGTYSYQYYEVIKSDPVKDIALLGLIQEVSGPSPELPYLRLLPPDLGTNSVPKGEDVVFVGYPKIESDADPVKCFISSDEYQLDDCGNPIRRLDKTGKYGHSGSPVISTKSGYVVGYYVGDKDGDGIMHPIDYFWEFFGAVPASQQKPIKRIEEYTDFKIELYSYSITKEGKLQEKTSFFELGDGKDLYKAKVSLPPIGQQERDSIDLKFKYRYKNQPKTADVNVRPPKIGTEKNFWQMSVSIDEKLQLQVWVGSGKAQPDAAKSLYFESD